MNHHEAPPGPPVNLVLPAPAQALRGRVHELLRGGFRDDPERPRIVLAGATLRLSRRRRTCARSRPLGSRGLHIVHRHPRDAPLAPVLNTPDNDPHPALKLPIAV